MKKWAFRSRQSRRGKRRIKTSKRLQVHVVDCTKEASRGEADLSHARLCFRKQLQHGLRHSLFGESAPKNTKLTHYIICIACLSQHYASCRRALVAESTSVMTTYSSAHLRQQKDVHSAWQTNSLSYFRCQIRLKSDDSVVDNIAFFRQSTSSYKLCLTHPCATSAHVQEHNLSALYLAEKSVLRVSAIRTDAGAETRRGLMIRG